MATRVWKKREGQELTKMLDNMQGAMFGGAEVNDNRVSIVYLTLQPSRQPDEKILFKLIKGDYSSDIQLFEVQRPRAGIAEVDVVKKGDGKTVFAFRVKVSSDDMHIENRKDLDDQIEKALKDQIKMECARQLKNLIGTLPEMVDADQFVGDLRSNCEVKIKARLQNGINYPMDVDEKTERTMAFYEVLDRAKEADISFTSKPSTPHIDNNLPF